MKLATLKTNKPDGELLVVSRDNTKAVKVNEIAPNLQIALENWNSTESQLKKIYQDLNAGKITNTIEVDETKLHSPLPRAYQWLDGSAYIQHVILVRKARNAEPPETLETDPLMYQGGSDNFLAPREDIPLIDFSHGLDFEGEVGVITGDVPMGATPAEAEKCIRLIVMINDVSLRGLIPPELAKGFGFMQSKPSSAFGPFALTPDELEDAWKNGRVHLPLLSEYNGEWFGHPNASEMHFSFGELVAHAAKTRHLKAGTIIGSGTVSNKDPSVGSSCLAEKRMLEKINQGEFITPFMDIGETIKLEMKAKDGNNLFGTIFQKVVKYNK